MTTGTLMLQGHLSPTRQECSSHEGAGACMVEVGFPDLCIIGLLAAHWQQHITPDVLRL